MENRYVKYFVCLLFCFFVSPLITKATCDYQRMAELSKIASNVQFSYTYKVENNMPIFYLSVSNITSDIYVTDNYGNIYRQNINDIQIFLGSNMTFNIYSHDYNCQGDKLLTKYLNLPFYNKYSSYPECANYRNYSACQMWTNDAPVTDGEFYEKINSYKKTNSDKIIDNNDDTGFIQKYSIFIITGVICVIGISIMILVWRKRK